jgi:hypothetical protein
MSNTLPSSDGWPYNCELAPFFYAIKNKAWADVAGYLGAMLGVLLIVTCLFFLVIKLFLLLVSSVATLFAAVVLTLAFLAIFLSLILPKKPVKTQE